MQVLEETVDSWICSLPKSNSKLQKKLEAGTIRLKEDDHYRSMVEKLKMAQDLYSTEIKDLERQIQQKGGNCTNIQLPTRNKVL